MPRQKSLRSSVAFWIRSTAPRRWRDGFDVEPELRFSLQPVPVGRQASEPGGNAQDRKSRCEPSFSPWPSWQRKPSRNDLVSVHSPPAWPVRL